MSLKNKTFRERQLDRLERNNKRYVRVLYICTALMLLLFVAAIAIAIS